MNLTWEKIVNLTSGSQETPQSVGFRFNKRFFFIKKKKITENGAIRAREPLLLLRSGARGDRLGFSRGFLPSILRQARVLASFPTLKVGSFCTQKEHPKRLPRNKQQAAEGTSEGLIQRREGIRGG